MDMEQYRTIFMEESRRHLETLNKGLLKLDDNPSDPNILNEIFRAAHTLKSVFSTMGYEELTELSHQIENVLVSIRNNKIQANTETIDLLRGKLEQISQSLENNEIHETVEQIRVGLDEWQNGKADLERIPVKVLFNILATMVRSLARRLNKRIKLEISGTNVEVDRTLINVIGDCLIHLIRNAADHGLEKPETRKANGKVEEGTIFLKAYYKDNLICFELGDDGIGISKEEVLKKALEIGMIGNEDVQSLSDKRIYELIFNPGFSTVEKASHISGRGVGLDIVKNNIESIGGSVSVRSSEGKGSAFIIKLPQN